VTHELQFERVIEADPEVVFDMFTQHEGQLAFYQGPEPTWIVRSRCELRVGGEWNVAFGPSEDQLYRHRHVFSVIERPHRLRMTTTETRLDGSSFETEMEFLFEDVGGGRTRLTLHHQGFPTTDLRDEHSRGLPKAFGEFGRVLGGRRDPGF
jgi:uncharacterized protein YndB with AHSA1/START domain